DRAGQRRPTWTPRCSPQPQVTIGTPARRVYSSRLVASRRSVLGGAAGAGVAPPATFRDRRRIARERPPTDSAFGHSRGTPGVTWDAPPNDEYLHDVLPVAMLLYSSRGRRLGRRGHRRLWTGPFVQYGANSTSTEVRSEAGRRRRRPIRRRGRRPRRGPLPRSARRRWP